MTTISLLLCSSASGLPLTLEVVTHPPSLPMLTAGASSLDPPLVIAVTLVRKAKGVPSACPGHCPQVYGKGRGDSLSLHRLP